MRVTFHAVNEAIKTTSRLKFTKNLEPAKETPITALPP